FPGAPVSGDVVVRGCTLSGQILLYAPGDQALPAGWSVAPLVEGEAATVVDLSGFGESVREDGRVVALRSQALPTGAPLAVRGGAHGALALGDLLVSIDSERWHVRSSSDALSGRPAFEVAVADRSVLERGGESFAIVAELELSPE